MSHLISKNRSRENYPKGNGQIGANALANLVTNYGIPNLQTQTTPGNTVSLVSVATKMRFTGIPRVELTASFGGSVAANSIRLTLIVAEFVNPASPIFAAGTGTVDASKVVFGSLLKDMSANPLSWGATLTSDVAGAAGAYTFDGLDPTTGGVGVASNNYHTVSGELDMFPFAGVVTKRPSNAPFDIDSWVVATLALISTNDAETVSIGQVTLTMQEQPFF